MTGQFASWTTLLPDGDRLTVCAVVDRVTQTVRIVSLNTAHGGIVGPSTWSDVIAILPRLPNAPSWVSWLAPT